ncbi:glycoside hydrolase family 88 protein [Saccharibacillus sp. CPCC 101409]|uniref:glycoside hydrolase family 88 protein n=1 Tax=Saccharibacillus sp. CPCC 101409 TaxID=3058041 RepID=UPI00267137C9|nr:glycoside hydrolase family 88 protein [Saccharibacillus sp. CPCC 101409]MDO3409237.1 glycoside hydrolase family 88 protein [Saccharibacillus sp. CPCC 101409]
MTKYVWNEENGAWLDGVWERLQTKMSAECERIGSGIPYIPVNGQYKDLGENDIYWWTNGFWGGMLWQMYHATDDEAYRAAAERVEQRLDTALHGFEHLHHDVGFMWLHTAVANYRLTGSAQSRTRGLHAATILAGRYNPAGKFIRAWNDEGGVNRAGWMIIDCLMNTPLLLWASEETGDPRFRQIAVNHADTVLRTTLRPDGSANHIMILDPDSGEVLDNPGGQGFESGSSWSRGQAWALYGMALSHRHTGKKEYLDAAKRTAHYFIANVASTDDLPLVDFRSPAEPLVYDSTAGTCAACGLLEIAEAVPEHERRMYIDAALRMLKALEHKFADWNPEKDGIIGGGTVAYHGGEREVPIIYGDYFFIEAVLRLREQGAHLW